MHDLCSRRSGIAVGRLRLLLFALILFGICPPRAGLAEEKTLSAWGWNNYGQLGDGTIADRHTAKEIPTFTDVAATAGGTYHTLVLRTDGTVWGCGWNTVGQIGDGTTMPRWGLVQVKGLTNVVAIAAGDTHSLALRSDGTVCAAADSA